MSVKPSERWLQHQASTKPPTRKELGMERAKALKDEPVTEHLLPAGSESAHRLDRACPCRPKVTQDTWWKQTYTHYLMVSEAAPGTLTGEAWDDAVEDERRRRGV